MKLLKTSGNLEYVHEIPVALRIVFYTVLSLFLLLSYFLSLRLMGPAGMILLCALLGIAAMLGTEFFLVFFLVDLFLQNALIASVTTDNPDNTILFSISLGTSFFITSLFAIYSGIIWLRIRQNLPPENRALLCWAILFSCVAIIYSGLGLAASDPRSVLSYLRMYLGAVMFLAIGIGAGYKVHTAFLVNTIRVLAAILVVWGICELFFTREILEFFNVLDYMRLKYTGLHPTIKNIDVLLEPQSYLNLSGQFGLEFKLLHIGGPNIHPISYAYELAFCTLVCLMYGYRILAAFCMIMVLLVGAKGAIAATFASLIFYAAYCILPRPRLLLLAVIAFVAAYMAAVIYYGTISQDFHILGLNGSIQGFVENPLGRGVGVGGNMSAQGLKESSIADFQRYQHEGAAKLAVESGFGVMLYQLGIATTAFLAFYFCLFRCVWNKVTAQNAGRQMIILPLALIFVLVNSVFQEEAFAPACLGLWLFFSGCFLAGKWRKDAPGAGASEQERKGPAMLAAGQIP